ncbi:MAG: protein kinase, partial [Actinomycetota bacterium]|nr:protein kinase [Actinomycetota bacterium]
MRLIDQIGSALGVAHRGGVVHRDVKPSNILLDEDGNAYLSDFEIAAEVVGRLESDEIKGYPNPYAAPGDLRRSPPLPQGDVYALAIVALEALTGRTDADPMLLPPEIARVISLASSQEPTDRYATAGAFVAALHGAVHPEKTVPSVATDLHNPYKGLRAFEEVDADDFFGRETLVASLVTELDGHGPGGRCLAVVGPSGCGKSSIVKAGLVPALRRGALPGSDQWFIVQMYPGSRPFEALAAALRRVAIDPDPDLFGSLAGGNAPLSTVIDHVVPGNGSGLLLVIDQFEEVFTLVREESTRVAFLDTLAAAVKDPETPFRLVLTLRADFYDRPLQYDETAALLHQCMVTVMPLSGNDLERAIVMPIARVGGALDPGLAGRIAADVADQPGALPLLQYAMTDLFERREGNLLTAEAYDTGGGVKGALGTRAEDIYGGLLPVEQAAARQVFLRLVTLGEGTEDTRRRVRRSELMSLEGLSGPALAVIETYGHHRLLSFDRNPVTRAPTVEVAHEALLREWSRLRSWIDDQRSDVRLHLQLADGTAEWIEADRDPEFLLTGGRLEHIDGWATSTDFASSEAERAFLEASIAQRDREVVAEEVR